jgi:hypothetical protein
MCLIIRYCIYEMEYLVRVGKGEALTVLPFFYVCALLRFRQTQAF